MDNVSKEIRSQTMKNIKSSNTKLEREITKELWQRGFRFRTNVHDLLGKPDISIKKYKVVIFIDSCFWHGCPLHCRVPSSNTEYWESKISKNKKRDSLISASYKQKGWNILRIWEHELDNSFKAVMEIISNFILSSKSKEQNAK
ncbi:MAG: very short patch repair endonuclease [Dethiobacter sp.]|jgi:DNA mismatch endonuclease (patch repair protein)|nr:very short patch repair endonuclease [Dethiobacter sp.]